ncbi:MAG: ABC transporter permease [Caldilineaceae bacterium]|nr:ABC transporter permease [Caldilineaceae bacterium]
MRFLLRSLAIFAVAARRLLAQRGLTLATALGLVASVAIVMSIPLYSDAIYYQVLQKELTKPTQEGEISRPPFAFMFRYVGSLYGLLEWGDIEQVDSYLWEQAPELLGLPAQLKVRYFRTDNFRLFPTSDVAYADVKDPLAWVNFATASNFADKITLVEGNLPAVADAAPDVPMEILVNVAMANEFGLQVGEQFVTFRRTEKEGASRTVQVPVVISGIWRATDPSDPYWFYRQTVFENQFFIPEESFRLRLVPALNDEVAQALWYLVHDGSEVSSDDVRWLISRISTVQQQAASLLPNTRLEVSPQDALVNYRRSSQVLNILLYAFSIPIIGLMLAFIGLVVGLSVNRQRNEIAVLRSRGATVLQVLGIAALEALLLGLVALAAGMPFSQQIAQTIGDTKSFLNFTVNSNLRVDMTLTTLRFGLAAIVVTMVAQVFPSFGASRHTIVTYKREQARTIRAPWWQRAWLDVLLLIPAAYGTYLLSQQGSVAMPGTTGSGGPFDNPLLFLVPALGALALTLFMLRLLPWIMAAVAWVAARTSSVGFLLATRYLARDPAFYTAPLVLIILTLSLSTFTASLAQTLDAHLYDQTYYQLGADAQLIELGQTTATTGAPAGTEGAAGGAGQQAAAPSSTGTSGDTSVIAQDRWVFVPVSEHLNVPEILDATRIGDFSASVQAQGNWTKARFIGVDRVEFPKVAYWRYDFAPASLGSLMNALAVAPEGVLLPGDFMRQNAIRVGDAIQARISSYGQQANMTMLVVGEFEYFPMWYPNEEEAVPLMVGNLEHFFEMAGGEVPYNVLVKTAPNADLKQVTSDLRAYDITVLDHRSARERIATEQIKPERQGLFGVLSVGFLAAALLTVLGFFLYALFSFRRRFIELGTLRAIGLSPAQMTTFLAWELAFVILLGLGTGTVLGALVSDLYIPYLQVGNTPQSMTPPFLVEIAWPAIFRIYLLFGMLFVVALAVLAALLLRMKIFQAIKLGETL